MRATMTPRHLSDIHTVLSSESRLKMLRALAAGPCNVGELAEKAGVSLSAASQHLAKIRSVGFVDSHRTAQTINYSLAVPVHEVLANTLEMMLGKEALARTLDLVGEG